MLFESENQILIAFTFVWLGLIMASLYQLLCFDYKNKVAKFISDSIYYAIAIILFFVFITLFAGAKFRIFCLGSFMLGIILQKIFFSSLIAKLKKIVYNRFNAVWIKYKSNRIRKKECRKKFSIIRNKNNNKGGKRNDRKKVEDFS